MNLLLDTHILLWAAADKLSIAARSYVDDMVNKLYFSSVSIWEIVIKQSLGRKDFFVNSQALYKGLLDAGYVELEVSSRHALLVSSLAQIHKDPFDRLLLAQAASEGLTFVTADEKIKQYPGSIIFVGQ